MVNCLERQAGYVASWSRQACGKSGTYRVIRRCKHNWNNRCDRLYRGQHSPRSENYVDLEPDEFGRKLGGTLAASLRPPVFNCDGAAFNPAKFGKSLNECSNPSVP